MRPREVIRLSNDAFDAATVCNGWQLVELLTAIEGLHPNLSWYVADVQTLGPSPTRRREPCPTSIGHTAALIQAVGDVVQFESGVFVGVPSGIEQPAFRPGGLWTEDDETEDLGDAVIEMRAFDTSYWSIATADPDIARDLLERFAANGRGRRDPI
ncbi:MAG: hypothetical protein KF819_31060 [Labilithrix sp.]|nr:hypothetical protein [Labilithrix sp.]